MKLLTGADDFISQWVCERLPFDVSFSGSAIGVLDGQKIVAGVIFHNYQPEFETIEVSMAAITPRWATRAVIGSILSFPFEQLNCNRITAVTLRKGASPRRFLKGLGFREEGVARDGFGRGKDAVIHGLLKKDWRAHPKFGHCVGVQNVMAA